MAFTDKQVNELNAPLDARYVKQRQQAGRNFSYIEAWHAIAEANRIFGFGAWDRETVEMRQVTPDGYKNQRGMFVVGYVAKVRITVRAGDDVIVREGTGYGEGFSQYLGQAHESAVKEAESDAMKRALMTFGNPFGLALYDKEQREVVRGAPSRPLPQAQDHEALFNMAVEAMNKATDEASLKQAWKHIYKSVLPYVPEDMKAQLVSFKDKRKIDLGIEGQHEPHPIEAG